MKKATREWVRKAEADFRAARELSGVAKPLPDQVCFLSQQAAEKYLKGLLEELSIPVVKTHNLEPLLNVLLPTHPNLGTLRRGLRYLTNFAVEPRYPGEWATKRQATSALRWAGLVRTKCRTLLGLKAT